MTEFKRENKYLVLKLDDIETVLAEHEKRALHNAALRISEHRGKPANSYVVVNESEPYAELVWKLVESGHGEHVFVPKGEYEELIKLKQYKKRLAATINSLED